MTQYLFLVSTKSRVSTNFIFSLLAVDLKNHIKAVKKPSYVAQGRYYNIVKIKSSYPKWFARKFARK